LGWRSHPNLFMSIHYRLPLSTVLPLAFDVLVGRKRSFREDALACVKGVSPPLRVLGREHIPLAGPCVVTVNHYTRSGFGAEWIALGIAAAVPLEMHWVVTGELLYLGKLLSPISRWALGRIGNTFGFTTMPPMPPRPADVPARARSVKQVLRHMKQTGNAILGLAPEGADQSGGQLSLPPAGVGRFALLLGDLGCGFVPVGAYEADGAFCLGFGPTYQLKLLPALSTEEKDRQAAKIIMERIAVLLPEHLRGEFT